MPRSFVYLTREFAAAHRLPDETTYGNCANNHGHNFVLTVKLSGTELENAEECLTDYVESNLDHRDLTEICSVPTVENIGMKLVSDLNEVLPEGVVMHEVELRETARNSLVIGLHNEA